MIRSGTVVCTPCGDQAFLSMRSELPTPISSKETICEEHRVRKQNGWDARARNLQGKKIFAALWGDAHHVRGTGMHHTVLQKRQQLHLASLAGLPMLLLQGEMKLLVERVMDCRL